MKTHKGIILTILALAQFMVVLDASIVNVALPAILKGLNFSQDNLQWVVTAYTLAFGGFLLLGGRAADLFGRKRMFLIGIIGFTVASAVVGAAQSEAMMIISRGIQGLAAAFMSPAALSIVLTEFKEGNERNKALGVWGGVAAGGAAAGLLFGGILTQYLGWRWDFLVNVPVGIIVSLLAVRYIPTHGSTSEHRDLDLPGAFLVTGSLISLVYGITKAPGWGWTSGPSLLWLGGAAVLMVLFLYNESRSKHPLVPLTIFRIRNLSGANLVQLPVTAAMFSMFFFISLYIQNILGFSPLKTGFAFLPVTIVIGLTATNASRVIARVGYKPLMVVGPLFIATGLFLLSHITVGGSYLMNVLPGVSFLAFGAGMSFVSVSIAATSGVKQELSGLASGLLNTAQQIGGALGLAILAGISADKIKSSLADAGQNAANPMVQANATVAGFHNALITGMFFAIGASVLAFVIIRQRGGVPVSSEAVNPDVTMAL